MAKEAPAGLVGIRRKQLEEMSRAELIETVLKGEFAHGSTLKREREEKSNQTKRNGAGAAGKANKFAPRKVLAGEVYLKLRKSLKRKPRWKEFLSAFEKRRPTDDKLAKLGTAEREWWDRVVNGGSALEKWWKAMNKD